MLRNEYKQVETKYELSKLIICISYVHILPICGSFFTFFTYLITEILILEYLY